LKRTEAGSKELAKQGSERRTAILAALARVTKRIRPSDRARRRHIVGWVLAEFNAELLEAEQVGRPCIRIHLNAYWDEHPELAPPK
jgi:hypothetical protein